jgi:hypothetical protein
MAKAQRFAGQCTEVVSGGDRKKPHGVVNLISTEKYAQRKHDNKIRWQAAGISFGTSATFRQQAKRKALDHWDLGLILCGDGGN